MAHSRGHWYRTKGVSRIFLIVVGVLLVGYTVGTPLHWRLRKSSTDQASCRCDCNCSLELDLVSPLGLINGTFRDCGINNPEFKEEMEKDNAALLAEELILQMKVANETLEHTRAMIMDAKKTAFHYQREAEKCNAGMDACEEARERAERELIEEYKLSVLWEKRARALGWNEDGRTYI